MNRGLILRKIMLFGNISASQAKKAEDEESNVFSWEDRIASPGEFASEWRNHLTKLGGAYREELYKRVVQACKKGPLQGSPRCSDDLRPTLDRLLAALNKFCDFRAVEDDVKVVLYFDEAHELYGGSQGPRLYDIMQSSLSWSSPGKSRVHHEDLCLDPIFSERKIPPSTHHG
ncbi:hypothetical protein L210DRAFT_3645818 [Boletus edulis BED1]|uniref:Uncharacterized protein n=1 Tax=Boletus edulis BED1 TaxID=1328754 RepID=A0AAD4GET3_BOLED|nr:hypothetical protein L210DRAFT_3645818 [Boletus edulis BED1]